MSTKTFLTPKSRSSDNPVHHKTINGTKGSTKTPDCFKPISLGTPISAPISKISGNHTTNNDNIEHEKLTEENISITVAIRVRPLLTNESNDPKIKTAVSVDGNSITVEHGENRSSLLPYHFTFDHCFWSLDENHPQFADQGRVYQTVARQLLHNAFEGYNTCLFAYGQTGSGKSYSIMGSQKDQGIIPRFGKDLFDKINTNVDKSVNWCVEISFFEIYNEKIHDLLASSPESSKKAAMRVREHPILGPYVEDLATFVVSCYDDFAGWLSIGNKQRATAATGLNEKSSRSHSALTVVICRRKTEIINGKPVEQTRKSKVNIIDLAGSERVGAHSNIETRVKEGVCINKSLLILGKVISQLAEMSTNNKKLFVPYRESVLTWLLKESLGGNSKTTMLATISPTNLHLEETLSTLRYAKQARNIVNVARVNEDPDVRLIRELRAEIEMLRKQQDLLTLEENKILREKLRESEMLLKQATKTSEEKLDQAKRCIAEEAKLLQKAGIAFQVDNKLPRLVNLNQDPQLTETLNYILQEGETCLGCLSDSPQEKVIHLNGSLIEERHCMIKNQSGNVYLIPYETAQTYVNGHQIKTETKLFHGDRLILGGQHYFRFVNPLEEQKGLSDNCQDYVYTQTEFLKIQDERIKEEIVREREKVRKEMLEEIGSIKKECESAMNFQRQDYENHIEKLNNVLDEKYQELEEAQKFKNELDLANMRQREGSVTGKRSDESLHEIVYEPFQTNFLNKLEECFSRDSTVSKVRKGISDNTHGIGLYQLSVMIREANCLSRTLGLNLTFHQHDRLTENLNFELLVKVKDVDNNKKQEWGVQKFTQKLEILRHLDSNQTGDLFDSKDLWEDDEVSGMSFSPMIVESFLAAYESVENISLNMSDINASPNTSKYIRNGRMWSIIQSQLKETSFPGKSPSYIRKMDAWHISHTTAMIDCFQDITGSMSDGQEYELLLMQMARLHHIANDIMTRKSGASPAQELIMDLNSSTTTILLISTKIVTFFSLRGTSDNNLCQKFKKEIQILCRVIVTIVQEISNIQCSPGKTTLADLNKKILRCCSLTGKIVASLGISLSEDKIIEGDLKKSFVSGLHSVTLNALQTALLEMDDLDLRLTMELENSCNETSKLKSDSDILADWHTIMKQIREWTSSFKRFQETAIKENTPGNEFINFTSSNSQQIIINFSSLIDHVNSIFETLAANFAQCVGKKTKGLVNVNGLIEEIQLTMDSLMSVKCVNNNPISLGIESAIDGAQNELRKSLEGIRSRLKSFKQKLHSPGRNPESPLHSKGTKVAVKSEVVSKNQSPKLVTPKSNNSVSRSTNASQTVLSHVNGQSSSYAESVSQASTSIWTTETTLFDSQNSGNTFY